jgi:hypothetical protein
MITRTIRDAFLKLIILAHLKNACYMHLNAILNAFFLNAHLNAFKKCN